MSAVDKIKALVAEDVADGIPNAWAEAFDSLGLHQYGDTLSCVINDMPIAAWKVDALLDYMERACGERP